ncbi:MAG: translation initiation factor Sui1 [Candidatus Methanolliviera sp. GoM_asphalt]|nr:MAG: translation initiation factor Sui1 [Candidatus Methanolliviera sp. GoM_asphalt]
MMNQDVCPKCGLPKELCICEEVAKESQKVTIRVNRRRYGKEVTVVDGMDGGDINLDELARFLKSRLACGGTVKDSTIELQGQHKARVREMLISKGFSPGQIKVV